MVTNDPDDVAALFAEGALLGGTFREPWVGRDQIVDRWTSGRQEDVRTAFDVVAVEGEDGVAHWSVSARTQDGGRKEWDGVLVIEFGPDGRCREHREWFSQREIS